MPGDHLGLTKSKRSGLGNDATEQARHSQAGVERHQPAHRGSKDRDVPDALDPQGIAQAQPIDRQWNDDPAQGAEREVIGRVFHRTRGTGVRDERGGDWRHPFRRDERVEHADEPAALEIVVPVEHHQQGHCWRVPASRKYRSMPPVVRAGREPAQIDEVAGQRSSRHARIACRGRRPVAPHRASRIAAGD